MTRSSDARLGLKRVSRTTRSARIARNTARGMSDAAKRRGLAQRPDSRDFARDSENGAAPAKRGDASSVPAANLIPGGGWARQWLCSGQMQGVEQQRQVAAAQLMHPVLIGDVNGL